jgi:8-oxo-dGTP diphosphatase
MSRASGIGPAAETYPVIEWSGAILANRHGELLLNLRAADKRFYAGQWDLIGGTVEHGESPAQCMVRELQEEAGIVPETLEWVADFDVTLDGGAHACLHVFFGRLDKPAADLILGEGLEHRFVGPGEFASLDIVPGTKDLLQVFATHGLEGVRTAAAAMRVVATPTIASRASR